MKLFVLATVAALAVGALAPTAASADRWHHGNRWRTKRVCTTHWYHGHRVRRCRTVRVRW